MLCSSGMGSRILSEQFKCWQRRQIFVDGSPHAQTPLFRFAVDLLHNKLSNLLYDSLFVVDLLHSLLYSVLHNKSTTNRSKWSLVLTESVLCDTSLSKGTWNRYVERYASSLSLSTIAARRRIVIDDRTRYDDGPPIHQTVPTPSRDRQTASKPIMTTVNPPCMELAGHVQRHGTRTTPDVALAHIWWMQ